MNISKALKEKSRLLKKYNETLNLAVSNNSKDTKVKNYHSSNLLISESVKLMGDLVSLKTKIHIASSPVREKIFLLGELKNFAMQVKRMSTFEGELNESYNSSVKLMEVSINEVDKIAFVNSIEVQIEALQDELDQFNAITEI